MDERSQRFALRRNPFMVLGAAADTSRGELVELADERRDHDDTDLVDDALRVLNHPNMRLDAEIAWIPGFFGAEAVRLITQAENDPLALDTTRLDSLTAGNLLSYALSLVLARTDRNQLIRPLVVALIEEGVFLDPESIAASINDDREVAGFRPLEGRVIAERARNRIAQFVALALEGLRRLSLTMREETLSGLLTSADGENLVLYSVLDHYQEDLRTETDDLAARLIAESNRIDPALTSYRDDVANLIKLVRDFGLLTRSITLGRVERGLPNHQMYSVFFAVRPLAIQLFNDHGLIGDATGILRALHHSFEPIDELAERTASDQQALLEYARNASVVASSQPESPQRPIRTSAPAPAPTRYWSESTPGSVPVSPSRSSPRSFPRGWLTTGFIILVVGLFRWAGADADTPHTSSYTAPPRTATSVVSLLQRTNTNCTGITVWWDDSNTRWDRANTILDGLTSYSTSFQFQNAQRQINTLASEQRLSGPPSAATNYNNDLVALLSMEAVFLTSSETTWSYNARHNSMFSQMQTHETQAANACNISLI